MIKIINIFYAWLLRYNLLKVSPERRAMSEARLAICKECPDSVVSEALVIINEEPIFENEIKCKLCSCPCKQKSLIKTEKCPTKLWRQE